MAVDIGLFKKLGYQCFLNFHLKNLVNSKILWQFEMDQRRRQGWIFGQKSSKNKDLQSFVVATLLCSGIVGLASIWPNIKSKVSFEILRTSRFQNWPYFLNLVKNWGNYFQKTKLGNFVLHPLCILCIPEVIGTQLCMTKNAVNVTRYKEKKIQRPKTPWTLSRTNM